MLIKRKIFWFLLAIVLSIILWHYIDDITDYTKIFIRVLVLSLSCSVFILTLSKYFSEYLYNLLSEPIHKKYVSEFINCKSDANFESVTLPYYSRMIIFSILSNILFIVHLLTYNLSAGFFAGDLILDIKFFMSFFIIMALRPIIEAMFLLVVISDMKLFGIRNTNNKLDKLYKT